MPQAKTCGAFQKECNMTKKTRSIIALIAGICLLIAGLILLVLAIKGERQSLPAALLFIAAANLLNYFNIRSNKKDE